MVQNHTHLEEVGRETASSIKTAVIVNLDSVTSDQDERTGNKDMSLTWSTVVVWNKRHNASSHHVPHEQVVMASNLPEEWPERA